MLLLNKVDQHQWM